MELFLGIDLGTSGCRACAIDASGRCRAETRTDLPTPRRDGARVEQDPAHWWTAVDEVMGALAAELPAGSRPIALAVDGTSATLLLCDADGRSLGPALMYNDARAVDAAARIAQLAPAACGAQGPSSSLAKLLHRLPDAAGARHALHQADWVLGRLGAGYGLSDENNALKLGYDAVARRWPAWLDALGVPRHLLPRVVPPGTPVGTLTAALAARWGLPADLLLVAGTTDSTAAFLATGATAPGEAVTSLGSTLVVKVLSERPVFAPAYGVYSHRLDDLWLAGGASNSGGTVLRRYFSDAQLAALTPALDPDHPTDLDYYPLPAPGERFPRNDPALAPRLEPRPADDARFLQGLLEGLARIEREGYQRLAELGAPYPRRVLTVGGGAANPAWRAIRARLLGVPVEAAAATEAACGAARLARRGGAR